MTVKDVLAGIGALVSVIWILEITAMISVHSWDRIRDWDARRRIRVLIAEEAQSYLAERDRSHA